MCERTVVIKPEWRRVLTPEQFAVTQQGMTEPAYAGRYSNFHDVGVYRCVCCGSALFSSEAKFSKRTKWPTFSAPIAAGNIRTATDDPYYPIRSAVLCAHCGAHLGYVLDLGRPQVGMRYIINSCALTFVGCRGSADRESLVPSAAWTPGQAF